MNRNDLSIFAGIALVSLAFLSVQASRTALAEAAPASSFPEISPETIAAEMDPAQFNALFAQIKPAASELRWLEIPWIGTLLDGRSAGVAAGKPMFLWAMNGHPLGTC